MSKDTFHLIEGQVAGRPAPSLSYPKRATRQARQFPGGTEFSCRQGHRQQRPGSTLLLSETRKSCRVPCKSKQRKSRNRSVAPSENHPLRPASTQRTAVRTTVVPPTSTQETSTRKEHSSPERTHHAARCANSAFTHTSQPLVPIWHGADLAGTTRRAVRPARGGEGALNDTHMKAG